MMPPRKLCFVLFLSISSLLLLPSKTAMSSQLYADLVLLGGKIWTVSAAQREVQAVASRDGRIVAAGSDDDISRLIGPATRVIRLEGKRVVPGFNDSHVHFIEGGRGLASVQLRDARSPEEFRERIKAFAAKLPKGRWITEG